MADRTVLLMPHEPRRFTETINYVTSPGYATDGSARDNHPAPGGGPSALVTSKATFRFDDRGELSLRSVHPGVEISDVVADFPWEMNTAEDIGNGTVTTTEPTTEELDLIRMFDPDGF